MRPSRWGSRATPCAGYTQRWHAPTSAKALAVTRELGIHYWESYPDHVPMTADPQQLAERKRQLEAAGVTLIGYGVVHLGKDEAANRKYFDFARAMGLKYFSASPEPGSFDLLDKLVAEYGVAVGIHNHGPGDRFAKIETIEKAIKDHHPKIGCCVDTGHFLRSREDPVQAVEVFGKRVYGVHLKDVKDAKTFTVLGQGDLRTVDLLKALAAQQLRILPGDRVRGEPGEPRRRHQGLPGGGPQAIAEATQG